MQLFLPFLRHEEVVTCVLDVIVWYPHPLSLHGFIDSHIAPSFVVDHSYGLLFTRRKIICWGEIWP